MVSSSQTGHKSSLRPSHFASSSKLHTSPRFASYLVLVPENYDLDDDEGPVDSLGLNRKKLGHLKSSRAGSSSSRPGLEIRFARLEGKSSSRNNTGRAPS